MSVSKINENCYLKPEEVRTFIRANTLHAIDKELLKIEWEKIEILVSIEQDRRRFLVSVVEKLEEESKEQPKELANCLFPIVAASEEDHLRMMMGATMKILDDLKHKELSTEKPVLHVIKGGLNG